MANKCYIYTKNWDKDKSVIQSTSIDRAEAYHKKIFRTKNPGGYSCAGKPFGTKKVITIPRSFKPKPKKPDFIDRLISYEHGNMSPSEQVRFLREVKRKKLANKLQGHYGREIKRRGI